MKAFKALVATAILCSHGHQAQSTPVATRQHHQFLPQQAAVSRKVGTVRRTGRHRAISQHHASALAIRGGASSSGDFQVLPISKDRLMSIIIGYYAVTGVVGVADPSKVAGVMYAPYSREGSFASLCYEMIGSGTLSIALALYLAKFTRRSVVDIVCVSALPGAYVTFRHLLKGTTVKLGCKKGVWDLIMAQYILGIFFIAERIGNTDTIATIFACLPTIAGFTGMLSLSYPKAFYGIDIRDGATEAAYRWMSRISFQYGLLNLLLLRGFSVSKAAGYLSLVYAFQCLDFAYLTEDIDGYPRQPDWIMNFLIIGWTLVGATLIRLEGYR